MAKVIKTTKRVIQVLDDIDSDYTEHWVNLRTLHTKEEEMEFKDISVLENLNSTVAIENHFDEGTPSRRTAIVTEYRPK